MRRRCWVQLCVWNAGAPAWSVGEVCRGCGCCSVVLVGSRQGTSGRLGVLREDAVGPTAEWCRRRGRRWAVPDGGKEERDEVEMDGVRCFLPLSGDVGESGLAGCVARNWRMRARVGGANGVAECRPMPCTMVSPSGGAAWGLAAQRERLAVMAWIASFGREVVRVDSGRSPRCPCFGVRAAVAVVRHIAPPRSGERVGSLQLRHVAVVGGEEDREGCQEDRRRVERKPRDGHFRPSPRVPVPAAPVTRGAHCPLVFCTPVPGTRNLPAPSAKKYPQFTRTLRFCTRNLPAPYLACTRTVPAPVTVPTPVRFCPLSTRRPLLPSHPRSPSPVHTRDPRAPCPRWCPVPVAPAPGRYPQPATVPAPVRFRPRGARRPCATRTRCHTRTRALPAPMAPAAHAAPAPVAIPTPVPCPSPGHPPPVRYPHPWQYPHPHVPRARTTRRPHGARTRSLPTSSHC